MSITDEAARALAGVDDVDWASLHHPYGPADDVAGHLRGFLCAPDTDDAIEAATFFGSRFVCQGIDFGSAAPHAVPFMLRLLAAPGVSGRGPVMGAILTMLRIAVRRTPRDMEPALQLAWLDAMGRHADEIVAVANFLDGKGFEEAIEVLVVAFADSIAPLTARAPRTVREIVARIPDLDVPHTPGDRIVAWMTPRWDDVFNCLVDIEAHVPDEYLPSEGGDDDDGEDVEESQPVETEAEVESRNRAACARTPIVGALARDRAALTELYLAYLRVECDVVVTVQDDQRLNVKAPAFVDERKLFGSVALRTLLSSPPPELPIDGSIECDEAGSWLALLVERDAEFESFLESCAFVLEAAG